ncbi:hypothetical protein [Roseospira visakhapatnamensis]|uniref:Uncharacterized protein n=1 Tax=Roseospira visakhapatnamensis TaxID=390880 RepID=A0A7W6RBC9_9PROT|nr:hypothetical protein [Roseospira visakhapatnamensis]MBB4264809.1 hypothetical protein [Roseospira visakhapatnamensis]
MAIHENITVPEVGTRTTTRRAFVATAAATATSAAIAVPALAWTPGPEEDLTALYADLMVMAERIHATGATPAAMRNRMAGDDGRRTPENSGHPQAVCDVLNESIARLCKDGGLPEAWWRRFITLEDRFMAIEPQTLRGAALQYSWRHEFDGTTWDDDTDPPAWWFHDQVARVRFRDFLHGGRGEA